MRTLLCALLALSPALAQNYQRGPDSERQPGVPQGTVTKHTWTSTIFPGTTRDYWVYVPAQYDGSRPACVLVVQDGGGWVSDTGAFRAHIVLDNLIHKKEMPVTIGIFINPGVLAARSPEQQNRYNRSYEYDGMSDRYARFLIEEILPEVGKRYKLSENPDHRAIAGSSSGGIAAFTVAWLRPDAFHRVISFIGSYTNLRGGEVYPNLVRKSEPKPLRVFLQDGRNDLNIWAGSWFHANQALAAALDYVGYESTFVVGEGAHDSKQSSAILPDALRWLWKDFPKPVARSKGRAESERYFAATLVDPDSGWEVVSDGHRFTEGPAVDRAGNVYFTDIPNNRIHRVGVDGKVSVFQQDTGGANGLMFGADGRLYAAQNGRKRVVAYAPDGGQQVVAEGFTCNDLAVSSRGAVYVTDPPARRVWLIEAGGAKRVVYEGKSRADIHFPNGVRLSPDESLLVVADTGTKWVWSFQVQADGSLAHGEPFYRMETPDESSMSGADGMTFDSEGYLYVATRLGVQVCDPPGRVVAILSHPRPESLSNAVFAGPNLEWLYVTAGERVYRRHMRRKGVYPWQPVKPPQPRL